MIQFGAMCVSALMWSNLQNPQPTKTPPSTVIVAEKIIRATATESPLPSYPPKSIRARASGVAVAAVSFRPDGRTDSVRVLQSPDSNIAAAVKDALEHWVVPPIEVSGSPVKYGARGKITFYFRINNGTPTVSNPSVFAQGQQRPRAEGTSAASAVKPGQPRPMVPPVHETKREQDGDSISDAELLKLQATRPVVVVDIGTREAYRRSHRKGALNIPSDELPVRSADELEKDQYIVIDCSQEDLRACQHAASSLREGGFAHVLSLSR